MQIIPDEPNVETGDSPPLDTAPLAATPQPAPQGWFTRNLYYDAPMMTGDDVREAQRRLMVRVDGVFGRDTQETARAFQRLMGLTPDGIIGPHTAAALDMPR